MHDHFFQCSREPLAKFCARAVCVGRLGWKGGGARHEYGVNYRASGACRLAHERRGRGTFPRSMSVAGAFRRLRRDENVALRAPVVEGRAGMTGMDPKGGRSGPPARRGSGRLRLARPSQRGLPPRRARRGRPGRRRPAFPGRGHGDHPRAGDIAPQHREMEDRDPKSLVSQRFRSWCG